MIMKAWGKSDKGLVRPTNQDAFIIDVIHELPLAILAICDGMGGANAGNVASRYAIDGFVDEIKRSIRPDMSPGYIKTIMVNAVNEANRIVYELSKKQPEFAGMGTTIIAAVATEDFLLLANVGDSRAYLLDASDIKRLTQDHSLVEEMIRRGKISEEDAKIHPGKNLITRAVGVDKTVEADIYQLSLADNQALLLCSDGLSGLVTDNMILDTIRMSDNMEDACNELIKIACEAGGHDNITVVLFTK